MYMFVSDFVSNLSHCTQGSGGVSSSLHVEVVGSFFFFYHCGFIYFCSVKMPPLIHPLCCCWWTGGVLWVLVHVNLDPLTMVHGGCVLLVSVCYTEKWISGSPALFPNVSFIILSSFSRILWMPSSTSWWSILRVTSMTSLSLMHW